MIFPWSSSTGQRGSSSSAPHFFHQQDHLMSMRDNPIYHFRRYSAQFNVGDLVSGTWAVEVS